MVFTWIDSQLQFSAYGLLCIAAGIFDLSMGLLVLAKDIRSKMNQAFFLFSISSFLWIFSYGLMSLSVNLDSSYVFFRIAFIGVPFIPVGIYLFSRQLIGQINKIYYLWVTCILAALFSAIMFLFTKSICTLKDFPWGRFNIFPHTNVSSAYFYSLQIFYIAVLFLAAVNFYRAWKDSPNPSERNRRRKIFFAFIFIDFGMADFLITRGWDIWPMGFLALTILIGFIAYMVVRHKFLNINLAMKRIWLIGAIYLFLLAFALPISIALMRSTLSGLNSAAVTNIVGFSIIFGSVLSMGPLVYAYLVQNNFWLKDHLASGLAHELKTPLSCIQSAADLLRDRLSGMSASGDALDFLKIIDTQSERLAESVSSLLNVARSPSDDIRLELEPVNFNELVSLVVNEWQPLALQKNLRIRVKLTADPTLIEADREKLLQVLSNTLSNAIKFSEEGTITVRTVVASKNIICSVKDEGRGIPVNDLKKVFDKFYQAHKGSKGSGLGLSIAKAWVEAHGGKIWAESEGEGKGTKLIFTLPLN